MKLHALLGFLCALGFSLNTISFYYFLSTQSLVSAEHSWVIEECVNNEVMAINRKWLFTIPN